MSVGEEDGWRRGGGLLFTETDFHPTKSGRLSHSRAQHTKHTNKCCVWGAALRICPRSPPEKVIKTPAPGRRRLITPGTRPVLTGPPKPVHRHLALILCQTPNIRMARGGRRWSLIDRWGEMGYLVFINPTHTWFVVADEEFRLVAMLSVQRAGTLEQKGRLTVQSSVRVVKDMFGQSCSIGSWWWLLVVPMNSSSCEIAYRARTKG